MFVLYCYFIYFLFLWQTFELKDDISIMHSNYVLVVDRNKFPVVLSFNNFYFIFIFELIIAV